jgi:hypothetical protein
LYRIREKPRFWWFFALSGIKMIPCLRWNVKKPNQGFIIFQDQVNLLDYKRREVREMILVNEATLKENKLPELHDLMSQRTVCIPPLIDVLVQIPDPRKARGKRHPLQAMLALSCVALLCGYQSLLAISEWSHNYGLTYLPRLGFTRRRPPGQATWYRVLSKIDWQALEEKLADWVERVLAVLDSGNEWEGVALDGKTLRGSKKQGAADTHLFLP